MEGDGALEAEARAELASLAAGSPILPRHVDTWIERCASSGMPTADLAARKKMGDRLAAEARVGREPRVSSRPPPTGADAVQERPLTGSQNGDGFFATYPHVWQAAAMCAGATIMIGGWMIFPSSHPETYVLRRSISVLAGCVFAVGAVPMYRRWMGTASTGDGTESSGGSLTLGRSPGVRRLSLLVALSVATLLVVAILASFGVRPNRPGDAAARLDRERMPSAGGTLRLPGALSLPPGFSGPVEGKGGFGSILGPTTSYADGRGRRLTRTTLSGASGRKPLAELATSMIGGSIATCDGDETRSTCLSASSDPRIMASCGPTPKGAVCASLEVGDDEVSTRAQLVMATTPSP